jgi:hypothetical protein
MITLATNPDASSPHAALGCQTRQARSAGYTPHERVIMSPDADKKLLYQHLDRLIDLYKHHLDLFWKWITLFVTVASAIGAYIFK